MDIRKIIKQTLMEADVNVTKLPSIKNQEGGADAALARAQHLQGQAEKNLSSLGVYGIQGYMDEQGIFSVDMLKNAGKFDFSFTIKSGGELTGKASYNEEVSIKNQTIVLNFTDEDNISYGILFDKNSIKRPFMSKSNMLGFYTGNKSALVGLQEDVVFTIKLKESGEKPLVEEIKITNIGIERKKGERRDLFSKDYPAIKVKGALTIADIGRLGLTDKVIIEKIKKALNTGVFYVRLSESKEQTIVLSDKPKNGGEFLVVEAQDSINEKEPEEWTNVKVKVGKYALGSLTLPVDGVIKFLRPVK
jgi:hypothetical protein